VVIGGALLCVIASFVPRFITSSATGLYLPGVEGVWMNNWSLTANLFENMVKGVFPLAVAALFMVRRYAGNMRFTIGSITLDQFGAVVGIAAALAYLVEFATIINIAPALGLVGALAVILGTSMARYIALFRQDFVPSEGSLLSSAVVLSEPRPRAPKPAKENVKPPVPAIQNDDAAHPAPPTVATSRVAPRTEPDETALTASKTREEHVDTTAENEPHDHSRAFWFAVPSQRHVVDPATGENVFELEPGSWILALEDRGNEFLVQDTDGKSGVLRDLRGVERG
jgi:hypothetical protein